VDVAADGSGVPVAEEMMYTALRSASLTLAGYLRASFIADANLRHLFDPTGPGTGNMVVSLNSPQEMSDLPAEGLSVWLYRILRDAERLNAPPERISPTQMRRAPLPLRLYYLMTPMLALATENSPETEQLILGKTMQALYDHPTLLGADLQGDFRGTSVEITARMETLNLDEISRIYSAPDRTWQLSLSYEVSVVYIESGAEPEDLSPVLVPLPEYGVIVGAGGAGP